MSASEIFAQALHHLPALLLLWATIYAAYWVLGLAPWPRSSKRDALLERVGAIDPQALGGYKLSTLMAVSLVSLFFELLLIRWVASEIRVFAYFKSLVLIACFLGFGLGCYLTRKKIYLAYTLAPMLALVAIIELPWAPLRRLVTNLSGFIGWFSDVHMWSQAYFTGQTMWGIISAAIAVSVIITLFGLVALSFVPFGQLVGWYLEHAKQGVKAYSVNVAASIAGIWLYTLLCFFSTPPVIWFAALGVGMLALFWRLGATRRSLLISFAAVMGLFALGTVKQQWWGEESWKGAIQDEFQLTPGKPETLWSPYQKLTLVPLEKDGKPFRYIINTNDSWYQQMIDLSPEGIARAPEFYSKGLENGIPLKWHQYNMPYVFYRDTPAKVLIAGGGSGNDAAAAVRNGAGEVTVVEIDPLIVRLGTEKHLESPYSKPNVKVVVNDARNFVQNTEEKYDLVVFSILDSHTTSSYYTNIRIDNYVYTVEAMQAARKLLKPDGLFVMSFSSERAWFTQRLKDVVTQGFGKEPLLVQANYNFFVVGPGDRVERTLAADPEFARFVSEHPATKTAEASVVTDDWPYLYQQDRGIPMIIWMLSIGLVVICFLAFRSVKETRGGFDWHFFFLGAAFMLLEVQIISKVALLFGTTWLVNSIVITTLLAFILLANLVSGKVEKLPKAVIYGGLFATMAAAYFLPANALMFDSMVVRGAAAMALYCSPVFFAGLIFISSFKAIGFRAEAFGSNLLGSLVGGLLDSLSFAIGINALVIVAAVLYLVSLMTMKRRSMLATAPAPAFSGD